MRQQPSKVDVVGDALDAPNPRARTEGVWTEEKVKEFTEQFEEANRSARSNAPYLRAKESIEAFRVLTNDATPTTKMRALGRLGTAVADALEDEDPLFKPQRMRLCEYANAIGIALSNVKKHDQTLEAEHLIALLLGARDAFRSGHSTIDECRTFVIDWLAAHGYQRAAVHVERERALCEEAVRAANDAAFNKAGLSLFTAGGGFAPMTMGNFKKMKSRLHKRA